MTFAPLTRPAARARPPALARALCGALLAAAGGGAAPGRAGAQLPGAPLPAAPAAGPAVLLGTVRDAERRPLAGVTVRAPDAGEGGPTTVTDSAGAFRLAGVPAGRARFTARRLGYAPADFEVAMPPGATVEVAIRMGRTVQVVGTVVVDGGARADAQLLAEGFYDRRRTAHGTFISPEAVESRRMAHASTLLRDVPSVTLRNGLAGQTVLMARSTRGYCPLEVWVDGFHTPLQGSLSFDDVVTMEHLKAVEVYRSWGDVPQRFRRTATECGAVVVWTTASDGR